MWIKAKSVPSISNSTVLNDSNILSKLTSLLILDLNSIRKDTLTYLYINTYIPVVEALRAPISFLRI